MDYYTSSDRQSYFPVDAGSAPHWVPLYEHAYHAQFAHHIQNTARVNQSPSYHSVAPPPIIMQYQAQFPIQNHYPFYPQPTVPDYNHTAMDLQYPDQAVHIHCPIPVSAYSTLLPQQALQNNAQPSPTPPSSESRPEGPNPIPATASSQQAAQAPIEQYVPTPQVIFQTPCELLNDLAARAAAQATYPSGSSAPPAPLTVEESASNDGAQEVKSKSRFSSRNVKQPGGARPENQRKAYLRSVANNIGFQPTDPDTITCHDKKRHYLECLEKYILWVHEQLRLVGKEPIALERVTTYRGLNSRSIRTLLVHMQDEARKLDEQIAEEEQDFLELQERVLARGVPVNIEMPNIKRNSIATQMMGLTV
ncbi:hypothetical protein EIP91_009709 [Steccherinum ochraceum]|uniref:Uncharacterized protein n=1 Tax=Steccherinum ochraceum TaxID=92696 RepID=A0A4R0R6S3_9APHY|nr:hypothetical protein EIP91_009709 [Steccherinum ochraceum]